MPDQDIVERHLRKPWKTCYRLLKGDHPPEFVAKSICQALAAVVRAEGGLSGFEEISMATSRAALKPEGVRTLAAVARDVEQRFGQQSGPKILVRAALTTFAKIEAGIAFPGPHSLVEQCLLARVDHDFFSKVRHRLVGPGRRFVDTASEREFMTVVETLVAHDLGRMARSLVLDLSATKLRAPRSSFARRTTAELIDAPLSGSGP